MIHWLLVRWSCVFCSFGVVGLLVRLFRLVVCVGCTFVSFGRLFCWSFVSFVWLVGGLLVLLVVCCWYCWPTVGCGGLAGGGYLARGFRVYCSAGGGCGFPPWGCSCVMLVLVFWDLYGFCFPVDRRRIYCGRTLWGCWRPMLFARAGGGHPGGLYGLVNPTSPHRPLICFSLHVVCGRKVVCLLDRERFYHRVTHGVGGLRLDDWRYGKTCGELLAAGALRCYAISETLSPPGWAGWPDPDPSKTFERMGGLEPPDSGGWCQITDRLNIRCWSRVPERKQPWVVSFTSPRDPKGITYSIWIPRLNKGQGEEHLEGYSHGSVWVDGKMRGDGFGKGDPGNLEWQDRQPITISVHPGTGHYRIAPHPTLSDGS